MVNMSENFWVHVNPGLIHSGLKHWSLIDVYHTFQAAVQAVYFGRGEESASKTSLYLFFRPKELAIPFFPAILQMPPGVIVAQVRWISHHVQFLSGYF